MMDQCVVGVDTSSWQRGGKAVSLLDKRWRYSKHFIVWQEQDFYRKHDLRKRALLTSDMTVVVTKSPFKWAESQRLMQLSLSALTE